MTHFAPTPNLTIPKIGPKKMTNADHVKFGFKYHFDVFPPRVIDRSPSFPPSVFSNGGAQDSPASLDYHLQSQSVGLPPNHRSNDPITEEENELEFADAVNLYQGGVGGGHEVTIAARPSRYAVRGPICHKPAPPSLGSIRYCTSTPPPPPQSGPVNMSELSERFTEMRAFIEPREQYYTPLTVGEPQLQHGGPRRDSNVSMSSAYYSSVPSDSSHTLSAHPSRRASEVSMNNGGYGMHNSPPYDPISVDNSRRSSEANVGTAAGTMSGYQQKMQQRRSLQGGVAGGVGMPAQRWPPGPGVQQQQPPRVPSAQPMGAQNGSGQYHGTRRASAVSFSLCYLNCLCLLCSG